MKIRNIAALALIVAMTLNLVSCGTILYPERKGQGSGRIDPAIAILDGVGLLLFLIPGVIAFAVDFNNDTIYLPGTQSGQAPDRNRVRAIKADQNIDAPYLERLIYDEVHIEVDLDDRHLVVHEVGSIRALKNVFASL